MHRVHRESQLPQNPKWVSIGKRASFTRRRELALCRPIPICSQSYRFSIPRFAGILSKRRVHKRAISRRGASAFVTTSAGQGETQRRQTNRTQMGTDSLKMLWQVSRCPKQARLVRRPCHRQVNLWRACQSIFHPPHPANAAALPASLREVIERIRGKSNTTASPDRMYRINKMFGLYISKHSNPVYPVYPVKNFLFPAQTDCETG